jgi:hypothetical protein
LKHITTLTVTEAMKLDFVFSSQELNKDMNVPKAGEGYCLRHPLPCSEVSKVQIEENCVGNEENKEGF